MTNSARLLAGLLAICVVAAAACSDGNSNPTSPTGTSSRAASVSVPAVTSPVNGETISSTTPTFVVTHSTISESTTPIIYRVEVATDAAFTTVVAAFEATQTGGTTVTVVGTPLQAGTTYYWHVRAADDGGMTDYSATYSFKTPAPAHTESPSTGTQNWPNNGFALIAWAAATYPERLAPTGSLGERQGNMAFLRDRMIEAGLCGGMQLGLNLKRGGPEISIDYLAHVIGGQTHGIDIGLDYDNHGDRLTLTWTDKGTNDSAVYAAYPNPLPCR